jgi:small subunit ribosomal protein S16
MALRIRLRRMGRKKAPHYRIVVAENTMPRDGRFVDRIGFYNPRTDPMTLEVDLEAARSWIARGATPTDTVRSLLRRAGINKPAGEVEEAQPVATTAAEPEAETPAEETPTEATPAEETPVAEAETPAEEPAATDEAEEETEKERPTS